MSNVGNIDYVLALVNHELERAIQKFAPIHSAHEGIAVILEEYRELEKHVFGNTGLTQPAAAEAVQLAAMGSRYVLDLFATR